MAADTLPAWTPPDRARSRRPPTVARSPPSRTRRPEAPKRSAPRPARAPTAAVDPSAPPCRRHHRVRRVRDVQPDPHTEATAPVARRRPVPVLRARARGELARRSGWRRAAAAVVLFGLAPRPVLGRVDGPARDRPGPRADPPVAGVAGPGERVHAAVVRHRAHEREDSPGHRERGGRCPGHRGERGVGRRVPPQPDLPGAHDRAVHVLPRRRRAPVPSRRLLDAAPEAAASRSSRRGTSRSTRPAATSIRGCCWPS